MMLQVKQRDFEKQLKTKLEQKKTAKQGLDATLIKMFKFFDLNNSGVVGKNEFLRAISKIGVCLPDMETADQIFQVYDQNNNGQIVYQNFASQVLGNDQQQNQSNQGPLQSRGKQHEDAHNVKMYIEQIKNKIFSFRGAIGLLNLANMLKKNDTNNSHLINISQFTSSLNEFQIKLDLGQIDSVFNYFDKDRRGLIDYEDFILAIKGNLSNMRKAFITQVYNTFDRQNSGFVSINLIKENFNPKGHIDFTSRAKDTNEVLKDLYYSLECYAEYRDIRDGKFTLEDFLEFNLFYTCNQEREDKFQALMRGVWKIGSSTCGGYMGTNEVLQQSKQDYSPLPRNNYDNQSMSSSTPNKQNNRRNNYNCITNTYNNYSKDNNFDTQSQMSRQNWNDQNFDQQSQYSQQSQQYRNNKYNNQPAYKQQTPPKSIYDHSTHAPYQQKNQQQQQQQQQQYPFSRQQQQNPYMQQQQQQKQDTTNRQIELILQRIRKRLAIKGAKGFLGMQRQLKVLDLDCDQKLNIVEFRKAIRDYRIDVIDSEIETIFNLFDPQECGLIQSKDFMDTLKGEMNEFRKDLVTAIFTKLDTNKDNLINQQDIRQNFLARAHPLVKSGKQIEEQVTQELFDSIDLFQSIKGKFSNDTMNKQDFSEFYENVSASIEDDKYFEALLLGTFKLTHENVFADNYAGTKNNFDNDHKKAFLYDHHRHLVTGGTVSQNAPFGTFNENTQYNKVGSVSGSNQSIKSSPCKSQYAGFPTQFVNDRSEYFNYEQREAISLLKRKVTLRGIKGVLNFLKQFRECDFSNQKMINLSTFQKVLRDLRIDLKERDSSKVFECFDKGKNGFINYQDMFNYIRGNMNEYRTNLVVQAFQLMDENNIGEVNIDELRNNFCAAGHPDVKLGKQKQDEVINNFFNSFATHLELVDGLRDQEVVTLTEFIDYYNCVNACIDDNQYFDLMIRNCWNLSKLF